jgi:diguanylate cyclase (GGDEF)-like protein/PAS domain S-box-containing protein
MDAKRNLRVVMVEDSATDAELVTRELKKVADPIEVERVDSVSMLRAALERGPCDVVISDFNLPGFSGPDALQVVKSYNADIPFILVSGIVGEEIAVQILKSGADDYLLKGNLTRLAASVKAQIQEAEGRRARRRSEQALRRAQAMAKLGHVITGPDGSFESWSETLPQLVGLESARMPASAREWLDLLHPDDRVRFREKMIEAGVRGTRVDVEYRLRRVEGGWMHLRQVIEPLEESTSTGRTARWFSTMQDVTEEKQAEEQLRASESLKGAVLESSLDCIVTMDHAGKIVEFNPAAERTFGLARGEAIGKPMAELIIPPRLRDAHHRGLAHYLATGEGPVLGKRVEFAAIRADGTEFPVELAITPIKSGSTPLFTAFIRDITRRKEAAVKISRLNRVYAVLSGINGMIVRVRDRDELFREVCRIAIETGHFRLIYIALVDDAAQQIRPVAWAGDHPELAQRLRPLGPTAPGREGTASLAIREKRAVIENNVSADSRNMTYPEEVLRHGYRSVGSFPLIVGDKAIGVIGLFAGEPGYFDAEEVKLLQELAGDIAFALEHIEKVEKLDYLAYHDPLTRLANRTLLQEHLEQFLRTAEREHDRLALLIFDIERFKSLNDAYGRHAGDTLLTQLAERMVRSRGDPTRVARLGADQFALVLPRVQSDEQLARRLESRLQEFFGASFAVAGAEVTISAKIGIALFPNDAKDPDTLLKNAESALKKAKQTGERYVFYAQQMTERVAEKMSLEHELRQALEREEFVLHYQPKVELETRKVVGVEALIRWQSPERGLVPPAHFIPLLEETGLIQEVGSWALTRAARDHRRWVEQKLNAPRIAVNVSQIQLRQRDFVGAVERAISDGMAPTGIDLEITESMVMQDVQANIEKLKAVRAFGMRIAIDDFGTGYSSLGYLALLPVESLKIDRSFIVRMQEDPNAMTLVSTIISLAHSLRLKVIAEGVETEDQARFLRLLRCDEMQGYLFSKPLPEAELLNLLRGLGN